MNYVTHLCILQLFAILHVKMKLLVLPMIHVIVTLDLLDQHVMVRTCVILYSQPKNSLSVKCILPSKVKSIVRNID